MSGVPTTIASAARSRDSVRLIGVEREYWVQRGGQYLDARTVWAGLPGAGAALDPGDPHSRRGPTGAVITTDGPHAEIATAPIDLRPGCTLEVLAHAAAAERHLRTQLDRLKLIGYSTHINVEVDDRIVVPVARTIARRLALPIMLGLDRSTSPGVLIRPRPGRLEVGGEFAAGDQLRTAVVITVGIVLLAENCLGLDRWRPPAGPRLALTSATERYGLYVDRMAFGPDLYLAGRKAWLAGQSANELMDRQWGAARRWAATVLGPDELALADDLVAGRRPLPLENPCDDDGPTAAVRTDRSYLPRRRGGLTISVANATWWRAVVEVRNGSGSRWLTVPGRALDHVLDAIDDGSLDDDLRRIADTSAAQAPVRRWGTARSSLTRQHGRGRQPS